MSGLIDRDMAIMNVKDIHFRSNFREYSALDEVMTMLYQMQDAEPEPLTDKEQRIFLAAMEREEKVCEEVDRNYVREPYEDSLVRTCHEIIRKVKGALWTI